MLHNQVYTKKYMNSSWGEFKKIKDYKKIAETTFKNDQDIEGFVNHFNLKSESKGFVKLNLNVVY